MIGVWILVLLPFAILAGFGRIKPLYTLFAHAMALIPGIIGDYARTAYYFMTLENFSVESRVLFGSFFPHRECSVAAHVIINPYSVIGRVQIGARTMIAANTYILSGSEQHVRDARGQLQEGSFRQIIIGPDCWIGACTTIMADIGAGATIGAGSVVVKPIPEGATAVGNPARVV